MTVSFLKKSLVLSAVFVLFAVPAAASPDPESEAVKTEAQIFEDLLQAEADLASRPQDPERLVALGEAHLEVFDLLHKQTASSPRLGLPIAMVNLMKAQESFEEALAIDPQNKGAHDGLVSVFFSLRLYHKAVDFGEWLIAAEPENSAHYGACGRLLIEDRRFEEALPLFERCAALDPDNAHARAGIVVSLIALKRTAEAETVYDEAVADERINRAQLAYHVGRYLLENLHDPQTALPYLEEAVAGDKEDPDHHREYLSALFGLERFEDLLSAANTARALDDKNLEFLSYHALALSNLDRPRAALSDLQAITRQDPGNEWATLFLYDVYSEAELGRAMPDPSRAHGDPMTLLFLRYQSMIRQKYQESMEQAVQRRPRDVTARLNLGQALLSAGRYTEALREYKTVLTIDRQNAEAARGMMATYLIEGVDLYQRELYDEALEAYQAAMAIDPENVMSRSFVREFEMLKDRRAEIQTMVRHLMDRYEKDSASPEDLEDEQTSL